MAEITPESIARSMERFGRAGLSFEQLDRGLRSASAAPQSATRSPIEVIVNEHSRRFPRTMQQAFKQSEGYRFSGWKPLERDVWAERVSWTIAIGLLLWLGWAALHAPGPR